MAVNSRVGTLGTGAEFTTVHTRRSGRVLGTCAYVKLLVEEELAGALPDEGVAVLLDGCLRDLHPSVLVEAA